MLCHEHDVMAEVRSAHAIGVNIFRFLMAKNFTNLLSLPLAYEIPSTQ